MGNRVFQRGFRRDSDDASHVFHDSQRLCATGYHVSGGILFHAPRSRSLRYLLGRRVRHGGEVHEVLLQPGLVLHALLQRPHVLGLQDGQDELLVFVQVLLNQLGCYHLLLHGGDGVGFGGLGRGGRRGDGPW